MTWENRFRLLAGILGVVVLVGALTVVFNQRQNQITSYTAQVVADVYNVGADHPGTVIKQSVEAGDRVNVGQELFTVQSLQLKELLATNLEVADTEAYTVDAESGTITYYAVIPGVITQLNAKFGNSVPAGGSLATITDDRKRSIQASFRLVPRDYARVREGSQARVILPNDEIVQGTVTSVSVATDAGGTISTLSLASPELEEISTTLGNPGTPVTTIVILEDTGPLAGVSDMVKDFLVKVGLR